MAQTVPQTVFGVIFVAACGSLLVFGVVKGLRESDGARAAGACLPGGHRDPGGGDLAGGPGRGSRPGQPGTRRPRCASSIRCTARQVTWRLIGTRENIQVPACTSCARAIDRHRPRKCCRIRLAGSAFRTSTSIRIEACGPRLASARGRPSAKR
jgi:hypothetical protein